MLISDTRWGARQRGPINKRPPRRAAKAMGGNVSDERRRHIALKRLRGSYREPSRRSSMPRFAAGAPYLWPVPIYGYARVSTDGQTLDAQIAQLIPSPAD